MVKPSKRVISYLKKEPIKEQLKGRKYLKLTTFPTHQNIFPTDY